LLRLTEVRGAAGLYHTAFLFPTRLALAQVTGTIAATQTPVQGGSNHGTHLALYLADAEGNGIELA
jgi:catechol 2,3-dioxygenase